MCGRFVSQLTPAIIARIQLVHKRIFIATVIGIASYFLLPLRWSLRWSLRARLIGAWDISADSFLLPCTSCFVGATMEGMEANALRWQVGRWTIRWR